MHFADPIDNIYVISRVTRGGVPVSMPPLNVWRTRDVRYPSGQPPVVKSGLHILDYNSAYTYNVEYVVASDATNFRCINSGNNFVTLSWDAPGNVPSSDVRYLLNSKIYIDVSINS